MRVYSQCCYWLFYLAYRAGCYISDVWFASVFIGKLTNWFGIHACKHHTKLLREKVV